MTSGTAVEPGELRSVVRLILEELGEIVRTSDSVQDSTTFLWRTINNIQCGRARGTKFEKSVAVPIIKKSQQAIRDLLETLNKSEQNHTTWTLHKICNPDVASGRASWDFELHLRATDKENAKNTTRIMIPVNIKYTKVKREDNSPKRPKPGNSGGKGMFDHIFGCTAKAKVTTRKPKTKTLTPLKAHTIPKKDGRRSSLGMLQHHYEDYENHTWKPSDDYWFLAFIRDEEVQAGDSLVQRVQVHCLLEIDPETLKFNPSQTYPHIQVDYTLQSEKATADPEAERRRLLGWLFGHLKATYERDEQAVNELSACLT